MQIIKHILSGYPKTVLLFALCALLGMLCGCSPTVVTEYDANTGKITKVTESGGTELSTKDISSGGAISAVKVTTSADASSETVLPNVMLGSGVAGVSASSRTSSKPVMGASCSYGWLSSMWNSKAASWEVRYIGTPGESAAETTARMKALLDFKNGSISDSTSTDTATTNAQFKRK